MFEKIPTNQHYVWRHYLKTWAVDGKVFCHRQRDGKTFASNPKNLGNARHFYGVQQLTVEELQYLRVVAEHGATADLLELDRELVETFSMVTEFRRALAREPFEGALRKDLEDRLLKAERGIGELWHGKIEAAAIPFVERLRNGDVSFWPGHDDIVAFCLFLAAQYLRTRRMANAVRDAVLPSGLDLERVWPVESHLWANRIGHAIHRERFRTHASILTNRTRTPFVTGDQPVVNLRSAEVQEPQFYYPISPTIGLVLTVTDGEGGTSSRDVSAFEVENYNHRIFMWSEDQLYGTDGTYLGELASLPKEVVA